jgi:single-stranded-DNA-specific exonuclease
MHQLLERAGEIADCIKAANAIHIVTHIDADGITAGAIAAATLKRRKKNYTIECVKQLDPQVLTRLESEHHELVWFTDLGSSISMQFPGINKIITDHHSCSKESDTPFHLNPHLFKLDGAFELSGAGATYLVARSMNKQNVDLAALAVVGACGDLQDKRFCKLMGINKEIVSDGAQAGVIEPRMDIRFFGRETRPIHKLLQFATNPVIPGLSGQEDACIAFIKEQGIRLTDNEYWRKWVDLDDKERTLLISALAERLLTSGAGYKLTRSIIGESYMLVQEETGTELHDAKEYATLLNSTARYDQADVGLNVCLGDRGEWLKKARNLLQGHRKNLVEGLQFAREEPLHRLNYLQYFHAKDGIRDTIIGIVTNMRLNSEDVDSSLPLIGFANTSNGDIKVSARCTQTLVEKGVNLSVAMRNAAKKLHGVGGGHSIAAGATIPQGSEEIFIQLLEAELETQLHL